jgi:DNA-binding transcriptional MerR regulator
MIPFTRTTYHESRSSYLYLSAGPGDFFGAGGLNIMSKTLQQITFDFSSEEEKDVRIIGHEADPRLEEEKDPRLEEDDEPAGQTNPVQEDSVTTVVEALEKRRSPRGRLSLKEVHLNADLIQIPPDEILFQKQYYSIGEVSKWFRVNQSLIRYWETEFDILEPRKNRKGDRFFRPIDVKNLVLIHDLLRRRKFTIEGAKEFLKKNKKVDEKFAMVQSLQKIKSFFNELKASLS